MKLKQYIYEGSVVSGSKEDLKLYSQVIARDCKPYLKSLKSGRILYRGTDTKTATFIGKVRKDRRPTDMAPLAHKEFDKAFHSKFGVKARSESMFCFIKPKSVKRYGRPYVVYPVGNFKCIWSEDIWDLYDDIPNKDQVVMTPKVAESIVKSYQMVKNQIPDTQHEIMVVCDRYYAIAEDVLHK